MPTLSSPRKGSLQFWPRKRARKFLPSVNWKPISNNQPGLLGFICYKAGMASAYVKDNTPDSMTKNKRIAIPVTILECPIIKIFSVRLYKNGLVVKDIISPNVSKDKELKKKIKLPKQTKDITKELEENKQKFDDIRLIVYSDVKTTSIKKKPDMIEIALSGRLDDKINFVKQKIDKGISISEVFKELQLVDVRGVTKGFGTTGPVKRFGIALKGHKSEKGRRRPGSLGPWHPARVTFRVPQMGQHGFFTRLVYNLKIIKIGKSSDFNINPSGGFKHYGNIKTEYIIIKGSVPGPKKRQLILTYPLRESKKQSKKNFEFIELR